MQGRKKATALRWFSDYQFFKQMAKREESPSLKKYYQDRARTAKQEYDALMKEIGGK